ncbi:kinase-like domain-containing protein [Dichotomocladium elegans]|nr:kinase-like domain-containing protein [Dichotomocladium elegans]
MSIQAQKSNRQSTIDTIKTKIERNAQILDKAIQLRIILEDKNAQAQCDTQIRESEKYDAYLNGELQQLQERNSNISCSSSSSSSSSARGSHVQRQILRPEARPPCFHNSIVTDRSSSSDNDGQSLFQARQESKKTNLDLLRADIPINRGKVTWMLKELNSRLDAQERIKRQCRHGAKDEESQEKIALLKKAIQKYHYSLAPDQALLPAAGKLRLKIMEAQDLTHAPSHITRAPQTFVTVHVNNRRQGKTRPSLDSTWSDTFEMNVNKAAEIELVIYDRSASDKEVMIGLLWLKMADIVEELRQKKAGLLQNAMENDVTYKGTCTISYWFDVEPAGKIRIQLGFARRGEKKRPLNRLMRTGALREAEGLVYICNGHKFVTKRFYQIMRCAICKDYMINVTYQCEDCLLGCHKQCHRRVPFKCLAQRESSNRNFNIPHRLESTMLLGTNRCAHCGLMLPLAVKAVKKCEECGSVYHNRCAVFVPNFCSIDMEMAYNMVTEFKSTEERRRSCLLKEDISPQEMEIPCLSGNGRNRLSGAWSTRSRECSELGIINENSVAVQPKHRSCEIIQTTSNASLTPPTPVYSKMTPFHVNRGASIDDFNFLAVIGRGNFGKVMLAENKYTRELYAIKVLKKSSILMQNDFKCVLEEKHVFTIANQERHPFLVGLHSTFMTESRLFFVMEYIPGGDLMLHIQGRSFTEARARFYSAEVLLALEYLHMNGIIYRDLKLDNVVLDTDGHIKLTDYGLSKSGMYYGTTTGTFCGTPEFIAPEILNDQMYTRAVDWWALGVLLYEMLVGQAPFRGETEDEMFEAIMSDEIICPENLSKNAQSLLHALLQKDPELRLGSGKADSMQVRAHNFYENVNWDDLLAKRVSVPFLPTIRSRADTSNFDQEFTGQFPMLTPVQSPLSAQDQDLFYGFNYISDWALAGTPELV